MGNQTFLVEVGQDVKLQCWDEADPPKRVALKILSQPSAPITLRFRNINVNTNSSYVLNDDFSVTIPDVQISDRGEYRCDSVSTEGVDKRFPATVNVYSKYIHCIMIQHNNRIQT